MHSPAGAAEDARSLQGDLIYTLAWMWFAGRYSFVSGRYGKVTVARSLAVGLVQRARGRGVLSPLEAQSIVDEQVRLGHTNRVVEWFAALNGDWGARAPWIPFPDLAARVRRAVDQGLLVFCREDGEKELHKETDPAARIVRRITSKHRHLSFQGGLYRLIRPLDWPGFRDEYQVVKAAEAAALLKRIGEEQGLDRDVQVAIKEAIPHLTDKPVSAVGPDALFLLRRSQRSFGTVRTEERAVSPSQLAKEAKKQEPTWLEVEVLDPAGKPFKGKFKIELPDGQIKEGTFGGSGKIRIEDLEPGSAELLLPEFHQDKKDQAA